MMTLSLNLATFSTILLLNKDPLKMAETYNNWLQLSAFCNKLMSKTEIALAWNSSSSSEIEKV